MGMCTNTRNKPIEEKTEDYLSLGRGRGAAGAAIPVSKSWPCFIASADW